jgi:anti-sigma B factor antagonist
MANDDPLSFERKQGNSQDVEILQLTGPVTLRNLFGLQAELRGGAVAALTILDLSAVPYMDSAGMGTVINHYVHCQKKGCKLVVTGVSNRVLELFKLTKVDTVIPLAASIEAAEALA